MLQLSLTEVVYEHYTIISVASEFLYGLSSSAWGILIVWDKNGIFIYTYNTYIDSELSIFTS